MEEFTSSSIQDCLVQASDVAFVSFHAGVDSVSTGFSSPSFSTSLTNLQSHNKNEAFPDSELSMRIYPDLGGEPLPKHSVETDKLAELCQASDGEEDPVHSLVNTNSLDNTKHEQRGTGLHIPDALCTGADKGGDIQIGEVKGNNIDPSDASDLLQEIQEQNKKRLDEMFDTTLDATFNEDVDEAEILEMEKLSQEKNTLFSENLGLIAKDSKEFKSLSKAKSSQKRMRTRKSVWSPTPSNDAEIVPEAGHKHIKYTFKCGSCSRTFLEMCKLHNHLVDHGYGGSYNYDHILKTAFPKYDMACASTQTTLTELLKEEVASSKKLVITPLRNVIKPKAKAVREKKKTMELPVKRPLSPPETVVKKKRGRPRNVEKRYPSAKSAASVKSDVLKEKKLSTKIYRVKTVDGGDTWLGVKVNADQNTDKSDNLVEQGIGGEVETEPKEVEKPAQNAAKIDETTTLVNKYFKEVEEDIASLMDKDKSIITNTDLQIEGSRKSSNRKRKMSIPRKLPAFTSDGEIVNKPMKEKPAKPFLCEICPCKFQYPKSLARHEQLKHKDKMTFKCDVCEMKFMREINKKRHVICVHGSDKCRNVGEKKGLKKLKKRPGRKPKVKISERNIPCEKCGKILPESKAVVHARLHSGERPYICHICGKGLISDKKLKRHLLIHSEVKRHKCEVCGQGFSMKNKLRSHMYIHTGHKPYLCSVCGAEFNNSTSLLHHNRTVHLGDKRFECTICGGKYGKKSQLDEHMFSHSNEKTQTCRYCGKTFKHAKSLRRHEASHVTKEKFQCDQCDSKFSRKDNLERHKMCHFDVTLQCRFCKKKFMDRNRREDHEQYHINQKRLQCQICKEKFQDETYFYNHMEKQHDMTRDMVPDINTIPVSLKDLKDADTGVIPNSNMILSSLKMKLIPEEPVQVGTQCDTLNISMNAAGILPSSSQNLGQPNMQSLLVTQNTVGNQIFNNTTMNLNSSRILNQPINPGFVIPGLQDGQRTIVNVINTGDNSTMRLPLDQSSSDQLMMHEQQRLMQEALGTTLNMPTPGYRLQNLY